LNQGTLQLFANWRKLGVAVLVALEVLNRLRSWGQTVILAADEEGVVAAYPRADVTVERIGDLLSYELSNLRAV